MPNPVFIDADAPEPTAGGRLERYLRKLPQGLESYPEVRGRGGIVRVLLELFEKTPDAPARERISKFRTAAPGTDEHHSVPSPSPKNAAHCQHPGVLQPEAPGAGNLQPGDLRRALVEWAVRCEPEQWVSQVKLFALVLAFADEHDLGTKELEGLFYSLAQSMSQGGEPRALIRLLTPSLILRTGAERWERFHRNMPLETERTSNGVWLSIGRAEVFSPELAIATVGTFRALVSLSLLPHGKVAYAGESGGRIHYRMTWT